MSNIAYYRVSSNDQSIDSQRHAIGQGRGFDKEFWDEGISGAVPAAQRPAFGKLLAYVREGDTVCVYAVDRLGRDALDVQATVRGFLERGIAVHVHGLGTIAQGVGEIILAVLAQVADMERKRINERTAAGRAVAKASLEATGKTHRGKASLGRPMRADPVEVRAWKKANNAGLAAVCIHFKLSTATAKRYLASD